MYTTWGFALVEGSVQHVTIEGRGVVHGDRGGFDGQVGEGDVYARLFAVCFEKPKQLLAFRLG